MKWLFRAILVMLPFVALSVLILLIFFPTDLLSRILLGTLLLYLLYCLGVIAWNLL